MSETNISVSLRTHSQTLSESKGTQYGVSTALITLMGPDVLHKYRTMSQTDTHISSIKLLPAEGDGLSCVALTHTHTHTHRKLLKLPVIVFGMHGCEVRDGHPMADICHCTSLYLTFILLLCCRMLYVQVYYFS